jgi:hypothetical protein
VVVVVAAMMMMMKAPGRHTTKRAGLGEFFKKMGKQVMHGQYLKSIDS